MTTMIKCLSKEVQGKLRSGIAISSLQQCVEELILNSIDAGATCVGVRMDMEAFKVQVIDNGSGMNVEDMECIGNRYYTSKCSSVEDLENLRFYGFRGEAVASIVSLATLVEISSRAKSSVKTHVKIFKDGKGLDVFEAETARPAAGTTFVICNFFHNMPVRRKRMDAVLEGERIRHRVEAISLMHPSVSFTLKNDCTGAMTVQLSKARNTYHRFVQIHGLGRAQKLREIIHTHGQIEVIGYIGREGHYNNSLQFLYVNDRLLLKTRIHKLLNLLLRKLRSSNQKNDSPDGPSAIRSPKYKRGQELHGLYIINVKCPYSEYDVCLEPAKSLIEFKDWDGVLLCIEEAVKIFLNRENLVVELSQDDLEYASPQLFSTASTDQENSGNGQGIQATMGYSTLECNIGMTLASEPVHRKHKQDSVLENSVGQASVQTECKEGKEESLGEKRIIADEQEIKQSHTCTNELRAETQFDSVMLRDGFEPLSENNITEEEEPTFTEVGEESQTIQSELESEQLRLTKEEMKLNTTTSSSNVAALQNVTQELQPISDCIKQMVPDCQSTNGLGQAVVGNRKISLFNPFVHETLQTQDLSQINRPQLHQQILTLNREESSSAPKRKISLIEGSSHVKPSQKICKDHAPVILSKIAKITSRQKLSLCKEAGSLDRFRRIYGKTDEPKSSCLETRDSPLLNDVRIPQSDSLVSNPQSTLVCQRAEQERNVMETRETQGDFQSPPTLSMFTNLKPVSVQNRARGISLAAKLCHLKQHRTEVPQSGLTHSSMATTEDSTCLSSTNDNIQDDNNSEHPCDTNSQTPEPVPGCSTCPQSAERQEATVSSDWLQHYDTSVGKIVYVNKVTGLSRYEDPPVEETQVHCTSDVTNMAVSVISKTGKEALLYT